MDALKDLERTPLQSKKFIGFFLSMLLSRICLVAMIKYGSSTIALCTLMLCSTCVEVGYILGQAALDLYIRGAVQMVTKRKKEIEKIEM